MIGLSSYCFANKSGGKQSYFANETLVHVKEREKFLPQGMTIWTIDKAVKSPIESDWDTHDMIGAFWSEVIDFLITFLVKLSDKRKKYDYL